jgi:hypothetical protein
MAGSVAAPDPVRGPGSVAVPDPVRGPGSAATVAVKAWDPTEGLARDLENRTPAVSR